MSRPYFGCQTCGRKYEFAHISGGKDLLCAAWRVWLHKIVRGHRTPKREIELNHYGDGTASYDASGQIHEIHSKQQTD